MYTNSNTLYLSRDKDFLRRIKTAKTGLHFLMAAISSMFLLFLIAYILRSQVSDWEALSQPWQPLSDTGQLWFNSALLAVASIALEYARRSIKDLDNSKLTRDCMLLACAATVAFLIGQLLVWKKLAAMGFMASSNAANAFFYLLTGLHGLHLMGGLVVLTVATYRCKRLAFELQEPLRLRTKSSIELCATYWHFLLLLWLGLFALLTGSPESYAAIAKLCGF
ncbi:MAG: cytochrome c oxidase subunit 3 [Porticoccaceae bacterium]|nr:cytochrome c oxidase subunit 3 [Porticoccaceae bacterium]